MSQQQRAFNPFYSSLPLDRQGFDFLIELALDMRWSWNHGADELWRQLDERLWSLTRNPRVVLQTVSHDRIEQLLADHEFRAKLNSLVEHNRKVEQEPKWFQQAHAGAPLKSVAYFSMEFMLSEALPIYSGGLGNVAGDQLKASSNLGLPLTGVSLLYQQGYFRQAIDQHGNQLALFPYNDPGQLPITPVRRADGEWLRLQLALPGYPLWLRVWQAKVGGVRLLLLDSNDPANLPVHRGITSELYGAGQDLRLQQEIILGIGGWRLLKAMDISPQVCHLNEGHAAFATLERARDFMEESGQPFEVALAATRAGNLFTSHTPVPAGFDRFPPWLMDQYLRRYAQETLRISLYDLMALGRENPGDQSEPFNMAYLALRGSGAVNGVSRLHGQVSREIFQPLFPRWPQDEVPVDYVTNGVHTPTWDSAQADDLWTEACGQDRWNGTLENLQAGIHKTPDSKIWEFRTATSRDLIGYVRNRLSHDLTARGAAGQEIEIVKSIFDINALTLGFARRFASYKRPNLLLHDPERLLRILTNSARPVQLIVAGKAHPADEVGKGMIHEWIEFIRRPEARPHVVFLSDYDMYLTERLVQGVDVWINTPRRPWEASGTSGMKVLVNGGINLSELDGWWAEAYTPEVGWALGDGKEHGDDPAWDAAEAEALYNILEQQVIPEFYDRDENGVPKAWVARMRESMARLTPQFSANRTVREYTEHHYLESAQAFEARSADHGAVARNIVEWRQSLDRAWSGLRFGEMHVDTNGAHHTFRVEVEMGNLDPNAVRVELFADGPTTQEMERASQNGSGRYLFTAQVSSERPAGDYTARIIPQYPGVRVPLEAGHILWQR